MSLIDNTHSRKAGLAGLYGTIQTSMAGLTVTDPGTGQSRAHWRWGQIESVTLDNTTGLTEDKGRILEVQTSRQVSHDMVYSVVRETVYPGSLVGLVGLSVCLPNSQFLLCNELLSYF